METIIIPQFTGFDTALLNAVPPPLEMGGNISAPVTKNLVVNKSVDWGSIIIILGFIFVGGTILYIHFKNKKEELVHSSV